MSDTTMGQRIAERRKLLGLSQEAFGEKMGVSRQAISKWEADGTVPEIGKLIAMSRLFSVSVGWLLGVEDAQPESQEEGLSEKQLKMIEELLKKYQQPQPQKKSFTLPLFLRIAAIVAVVIVAVTALNRLDNIPNYDHQLSSLSNKYSTLQSQLAEVSAQLAQLRQGELLLASYEVTAQATDDLSAGVVSFKAVPNDIQAGEQAWLQVYLDEENVASQLCQLNGSVYTAQVQLPAENGYVYHYMVVRSGGDSSTQILEDVDYYADNLKLGLMGQIYADVNEWGHTVKADEHYLQILNMTVIMAEPALYTMEQPAKWSQVDLVLYHNDAQLSRIPLLEQKTTDPTIAFEVNMYDEETGHLWFDVHYELPDLVEGDTLMLQLEYQNQANMQGVQPVILLNYQNGELDGEVYGVLK